MSGQSTFGEIKSWSQFLIPIILGISLIVGLMAFFSYKDFNRYAELVFFISMAGLFLFALVKQHRDHIKHMMHMQQDREELLKKMRDMADKPGTS
uniref:Uncharacterized protein n=1 Tax=Candidatus Kentrum sp. FW TaxID=2126338 RepID=A0A450SHE6_9GAMM|nr:MAG: hypothetical protein BECKFW1821A_GA0114235_10379 [Candidatus Kentron sp. FW]